MELDENALTAELLQEHPLLAFFMGAFSLFVMLALAGSLTSWANCLYRLYSNKPILTALPWRPRAWGLIEIVLAIFLLFATQLCLLQFAIPLLNLDQEALAAGAETPMSLAALISLGYLLTVLLIAAWMLLRYRVSFAHIGFKSAGLPKQLFIGLVAGLMVIPLTMAISAAVSVGFSTEYDHPLLNSLQDEGSLRNFGFAMFAAVIVAPFAEEFLFRVLLQGWLQSIPFKDIPSILTGGAASAPGNLFGLPPTSPPPEALAHIQTESESHDSNPYRSPAPVASSDAETSNQESLPTYVPPIWPSVVAGLLFGLAHWGYGLSFVPLTFLGIVLGLLYRATQSIWPCVVVHFMLNCTSLVALGLGVYVKNVTG